MLRPKSSTRIERAAEWTARHRTAGPIGWGLAFWGVLWAAMVPVGLLAGVIGYDRVDVWFRQFEILAVPLIVAFLVGSATPGYMVGRAGLARAGKLLAVAGLMAPFAVM
jgi:hypothetical protein